MAEVNGANKHGWHERISLKSLYVLSNAKVPATHDRQTNEGEMTSQPTDYLDYTDPYAATHIDEK